MKKIIVFLSIIFLAGCGHSFCHPDRSLSTVNDAYEKCNYQAERDTGSMAIGAYRGMNLGTIIKGCMKQLGYGYGSQEKCRGYKPDAKKEWEQ